MFNPTKANEVTADLITRYGDNIIGLHTITGCMTEGIASAVEGAGYNLEDMIFVDNGAFSVDLKLIKEGKLDATVIIPCTAQGELSIKILYWNAMGMTDKMPVPGSTMVEEGAAWSPATVVDSEVGPVIQVDCSMVCPQEIDPDDPSLLGNLTDAILAKESE